MIGSVALMFEKCLDLPEEGRAVWEALFTVFERGFTTSELSAGYTPDQILSTSGFGDMVVEIVKG
jgi:3-isopropylmalate dehydrogenase